MPIGRALGLAMTGLLGAAMAAAQDAPLPVIPPTLPLAARNALMAMRTPLFDRLQAHNRLIDDFRARCGSVPATETAQVAVCTKNFKAMTADATVLLADKKRFAAKLDSSISTDAPCASLAAQLERDKEALRRQQKTSEMGVVEIDAWRKENEEALKEGAIDGAKFILARTAKGLEAKESAAKSFQGWMTRYAKQMKAEHVPYEALQAQFQTAVRGYVNASVQAAAGTGLTRALEAEVLINNFRTQAGVIARNSADADGAMKAALDDPAVVRFAKKDPTGWDLLRSTVDVAATATEAAKITPEYAIASLAVDGTYDVSKWVASRNRIMQQYQLSDTVLLAVASLQRQIEQTVAKVNACRAR